MRFAGCHSEGVGAGDLGQPDPDRMLVCTSSSSSAGTKDSVKGVGITNQRETILRRSKKTDKPLCNATMWDDTRTVTVVRQFENKHNDEGIEQDDGPLAKGKCPKKPRALLYMT